MQGYLCQARHLIFQGLWHEGDMDLYADIDTLRATFEVYVQADDYDMWRDARHYNHDSYTSPLVARHSIDVGRKNCDVVADEIKGFMRADWSTVGEAFAVWDAVVAEELLATPDVAMAVEERISVARSDAPPVTPVLAASPSPRPVPTSVARSVARSTSSDDSDIGAPGRYPKAASASAARLDAAVPVAAASASSSTQPAAAPPAQVGLQAAAPVTVSPCRFSDCRIAVAAPAVTPKAKAKATAKATLRAAVDLQPFRSTPLWETAGYTPPTSVICRKPLPGNTFNENFPRKLLHTQPGYNFEGDWHEKWEYSRWSKVVCKCLRHDWHLVADESGFAFCEDIIYALGDKKIYHLNYHLNEMPTVADLIYVVEHEEKGRYEATSVRGTGRRYDLLIRCVQGHSGSIGRQLVDAEAFTQVTDATLLPRLIHHTKTEHILSIVGRPESPGLYPGGTPPNSIG